METETQSPSIPKPVIPPLVPRQSGSRLALAGIVFAGTGIGFGQGRGWFSTPLAGYAFLTVAVAVMGYGLFSLLRSGGVKRGAAAKIQQFGGGTWGVGAFITWLILEGRSLAGDWTGAPDAAAFMDRRAIEWLMGFSGDSIRNLIQAAIWPFYWLGNGGWWIAAGVGALAWCVSHAASRAAAQAGGAAAPAA